MDLNEIRTAICHVDLELSRVRSPWPIPPEMQTRFRLPKPAKTYTRNELVTLTERLKAKDHSVLKECIAFTIWNTEGVWHGRARAKIYRHLKHWTLDDEQRRVLVDAVVGRLMTGRFAEQFKDQLRAAIVFDRDRMRDVAESLTDHEKDYMRRCANWILTSIEQRR